MTRYPKGNPSDWIRRAVGPGDVVIDGGANMGGFTIAAAETVGPTGRVFAVEPDPRCADTLRGLEQRFSQVTFIPAALVATPGRVTLTQSKKPEQSSLIPGAVDNRIGEVEVDGITLNSLPRAKAIKLDLQGGETNALMGASALLVANPAWCVELWPHAMRLDGTDTADWMLGGFELYGYRPRTMDEGYPETKYDELLAWCLDEKHPEYQHINVIFTA